MLNCRHNSHQRKQLWVAALHQLIDHRLHNFCVTSNVLKAKVGVVIFEETDDLVISQLLQFLWNRSFVLQWEAQLGVQLIHGLGECGSLCLQAVIMWNSWKTSDNIHVGDVMWSSITAFLNYSQSWRLFALAIWRQRAHDYAAFLQVVERKVAWRIDMSTMATIQKAGMVWLPHKLHRIVCLPIHSHNISVLYVIVSSRMDHIKHIHNVTAWKNITHMWQTHCALYA